MAEAGPCAQPVAPALNTPSRQDAGLAQSRYACEWSVPPTSALSETSQAPDAGVMPGGGDPAAASPSSGWLQQSVLLDTARALATFMMLQGHTLDAVLAPALKTGPLFDGWTFMRGLTSCAFLFLSGFVFVFVTDRRVGRRGGALAAADRRLRRFAFFLLLGYALHLPVEKLELLPAMNDGQWRLLLSADVLQCVAVMLTLLQGLALAVRGTRTRAALAAVLAVVLVAGTPAVWRVEWPAYLPLTVAAYFSPATGSVFPLFPWGGFVLLGAVAAHLHARFTGHVAPESLRAFARQALLPAGAALVVASEVGWRLPWWPFGPTAFWFDSPSLFCLRAGLVLMLVGLLALAVPRLHRTPYVIQAVARQSLLVYAVHLCLVYGSIWNPGLKQYFPNGLSLVPAFGAVAAIWAAMTVLASVWHWCRHHYPGPAWWVRAATGVILFGMLI